MGLRDLRVLGRPDGRTDAKRRWRRYDRRPYAAGVGRRGGASITRRFLNKTRLDRSS